MKKLLFTCVIALSMTALATGQADTSYVRPTGDDNTIFTVVQQMPKFPGDVYQWITQHLNYPKEAVDNKIQGVVYVTFIIEKDGSVSHVAVLRDVNPLLDTAAVQCVRQMPRWSAGMQNGHAVRVQYNIPINFEIKENPPASTAGSAVKITVFQANQPQEVTQTPRAKDSMRRTDKNCVKWNWSILDRGVFLMDYEFYAQKYLTIELGAGLTYRDFLFELTNGVDETSSDNNSNSNQSSGVQLIPVSYSQEGTPSPKYAIEGGLRYYPHGFDNFEGIYLEGTLSYRDYSFPNAPELQEGQSMVPGYSMFDTQFKFGYQYVGWYTDLVTDFYFGFGIRSATLNYYETEYITNNSGLGGNSVSTVPASKSVTLVQPLFGFKLGLAF
jgi:TonB family protein